jgi:MoaA/NifB/PqqE/SkfB family radical SAM enzyme
LHSLGSQHQNQASPGRKKKVTATETEPATIIAPACPSQQDEPGDRAAPTSRSEHADSSTDGRLGMIWAELGLECQAECLHCYAGAGPRKGFGTMTAGDWENVIRDAAGLGARQVTFIGGEPTLSRALPRLVRLAAALDLKAEIYTNMVRVTPALWELFTLPGVSLATSWYTSDRAQHTALSGGHDTWRQIRANIAKAVELGIAPRVGMIDGIVPGQLSGEGERQLRELGVTRISHDHVRQFGRGTIPDPSQACGACGHGRAAVLSDGSVTPCPMTRFLTTGNVQDTGLEKALEAMPGVTDGLHRAARACNPNCMPDSYCNPLCLPGACKPRT